MSPRNIKKVANTTAKRDINREASSIAEGLGIDRRMEVLAERKAYITLKDH